MNGRGFTLIELSIVLVIIALVVGGVMVGTELIAASRIHSQISQIEKYNTAANAFKLKYGALPGDVRNGAQLGFAAHTATCRGAGDGNGIIESNIGGCLAGWWRGFNQTKGETALFWTDLSASGLISEELNTATSTGSPGILTGSALDPYFPKAKIPGNYVYVWSGGVNVWSPSGFTDSTNYISIGSLAQTDSAGWASAINTAVTPNQMTTAITTAEAYSIDSKVDDGKPQTGKVNAIMLGGAAGYASWASGSISTAGASDTSATASSATTCYDNGNSAGVEQRYSTAYNSGKGKNCGLTFRLQ